MSLTEVIWSTNQSSDEISRFLSEDQTVFPVLNQSRFLSDNLNLTSTADSLEQKNYWALLLLLLCVAVVFGNVLVILSVVKVNQLNFNIIIRNRPEKLKIKNDQERASLNGTNLYI